MRRRAAADVTIVLLLAGIALALVWVLIAMVVCAVCAAASRGDLVLIVDEERPAVPRPARLRTGVACDGARRHAAPTP